MFRLDLQLLHVLVADLGTFSGAPAFVRCTNERQACCHIRGATDYTSHFALAFYLPVSVIIRHNVITHVTTFHIMCIGLGLGSGMDSVAYMLVYKTLKSHCKINFYPDLSKENEFGL